MEEIQNDYVNSCAKLGELEFNYSEAHVEIGALRKQIKAVKAEAVVVQAENTKLAAEQVELAKLAAQAKDVTPVV
jgi:regulator of replication initiation timing